jgi:hypothetical protein
MGNTELLKKHSAFFIYGWWAIAFGVIFFATFIIDYQQEFILKYKGLDNLGGIIGATTGICFSLAGLFFVLDNLQLQRETLNLQRLELKNQIEEMKLSNDHFGSQNKSLINQQYQTTFFSLLNNHTTLVSSLSFYNILGFEGLSNFYNDITNQARAYKGFISAKRFHQFPFTSKNPLYPLEVNKHSLESFLSDFITIVKLIDEKLPEQLYYDITNNYLTVYEKYFIGLYCDCFEDEYTAFIKTHKYDFLKYYKKQDATYNLTSSTYFPVIEMRREYKQEMYLTEITDSENFFDFYFWVTRDFYSRAVTLEKINVHVYRYDQNNNVITDFHIPITNESPSGIGQWVDYYHIHLMPYLLPELSKVKQGYPHFDFDFCFKYQSEIFTISYKMNITIADTSPRGGGLGLDRKFQKTHEV